MAIRSVLICVLFLMISEWVTAQEGVLEARQRPPGSVVTISGVILNASELGVVRYLQDSTAGIAIYPGGSSPATFQQATTGDMIQVTGVLSVYHGLLEINPIFAWTRLSSGNPLPEPEEISIGDLQYHDQGKRVLLKCVQFQSIDGVFSDGVHTIVSSGGERSQVHLLNGNPLIGTAIPAGAVDLTAIASYYDGVQFLIRNASDFQITECLRILPVPAQNDIQSEGFRVSWVSSVPAEGFLIVQDEQGSRDTLWTADGASSKHSEALSGLSPATFYDIIAGAVNSMGDTALYPSIVMSTASTSSGRIDIYFNQSVDATFSNGATPAGTSFNSMLSSVMDVIEGAQAHLDVAMYNSNRPDIIFALELAEQRGVRIRYIGDADQSNSALDPLPNFPVMLRVGSGIMHHKFIVADPRDPDRAVVWAGSTNHSTNQLSWDPNNAVVIQDQAVAKAYLMEFEEMWGGSGATPNPQLSRIGDEKRDDTPHRFNVAGRAVELYFSPSDNTNGQIKEALNSAEEAIEVALLLLTRYDLTSVMTDKAAQGLNVRVLVNDIESSSGTFQQLLAGGVFAAEHDLSSIFHHKYAIIDEGFPDARILTGSHNWTTSATTINDENLLIFRDAAIANIYRQEFEARWSEVNPSGIVDQKNEIINVFPNPVSDYLFIDTDKDIMDIELTALAGQLLRNFERDIVLDLTDLAPGLYVITARLGDGTRFSLPIVKQ